MQRGVSRGALTHELFNKRSEKRRGNGLIFFVLPGTPSPHADARQEQESAKNGDGIGKKVVMGPGGTLVPHVMRLPHLGD